VNDAMRLTLTLQVLPDRFAVCKLPPAAPIPDWACAGQFYSITRTGDELSIVCPEASLPEALLGERGWRCLRVAGTVEFSVVGVVASLVAPLADAGISVFVMSTFDTDYLLVKETSFENAVAVLRRAGNNVAP
jgi:hypothetical protein